MKKILMIILMTAALAVKVSAQDGWFWQYPKPQGNTLNDIFIFNENAAIAVGELGTVIRTTDGGENWDVQHHAAGTTNSLNSVWFVDDRTGWMVDNRIVLKTTDGGKTWFENYNGADCYPGLVHFVNADTGFVFGKTTNPGWGYGICCKTTNGGESWACSNMPNFYTYAFTSSFFISTDTGWITVGGSYGNELYKTTDCGSTWNQIEMPRSVRGIKKIQFVNDSIGFIIDENEGFLKTRDGGLTWEYHGLLSEEYNLNFQRISSMYFTDSIHGWIVGIRDNLNGLILRTNDGGVSWVQENMAIPGFLYKVSFSDSLHGWIVGQFGLIYRTTDGGESWVAQREDQYQFSSIFFVDQNRGWAVGNSNTSSLLSNKGVILYTSDGGENWHKQNISDSILFSSVYAIDPLNVFAVGSVLKGLSVLDTKGIVFKTMNGGQIWGRQIFDTLYGFNSIVFVNDSTGWISGTKGTLLKTTDRGNTWNRISFDNNLSEGKIQFINENIGWIGGTLKTIDGGETWNPQVIPIESLNSFNFFNTEMGWAVASYNGNNNILRTTDSGDHWVPCGITPPGYNFSIQFINETTGWISGFDYLNRTSVIIKTTDGGYSWIDQKSPCKNEGGLANIYFISENTGWAVGSGIIKTTNGGESIVKERDNENAFYPTLFHLEQNYPNPFNVTTNIRFYLKQSHFITLKIYDLMGKEVKTLVNGYKTPGEYKMTWTAENVSSGMYLVRLQAGNNYETKKLVVLK